MGNWKTRLHCATERHFAINEKVIPCRKFTFQSALLGTDRMGRDLLSRIIYGGRVSLTAGLIGVFLSLILGSVLGSISGYWGG
jgi:ABC-type dipeptide/oligopeptide/nickel transport system permease subunit